MALTSTPKIPTISSANSPYYYGGGGGQPQQSLASTIAKSKPSNPFQLTPTAAGMSQMPGFTAPLSTIKPYTDPNRSMANPTEFPGGQTATDQLYKDFPDLIGYNPVPNAQGILTNYLQGDQIRAGQIAALNAQLGSSWATDVLGQAKNLEIAYGGVPKDAAGNPLDLGQFGGTGPLGFSTGGEAAPVLGSSLGSTLLDPQTLASAQGNKFSALATIANKLAGANAAARAGYSGGAIAQIMAEHQQQADASAQDQANQFSTNLAGLYSNWLGNYNTASGALGGYNQDAYNRMMGLIQTGAIDPFGTNAAAAARQAAQTRAILDALRASQQPQDGGGGGGGGPDGGDGGIPIGMTQPIQAPTPFPGYQGTGAGGFTGSTTSPAVVMPVQPSATATKKSKSPYYYGGGG